LAAELAEGPVSLKGMIYSGADLIRRSGEQAAALRAYDGDRPATVQAAKPVVSVQNESGRMGEDTGSALLRFARFVHDETKKKRDQNEAKKSRSKNPYLRLQQHAKERSEIGQMYDIYI
jgi:hypothetical protein